MRKVVKHITNKIYNIFYFIKNILIPYQYPKNQNGEIFIHLGCGEINSKEFINVDSRFFPHIHHISQVQKLPFFPDNYADLIYTSHTLEHIQMLDIKDVLVEWKRVLKPGGILRISVPDFDKILTVYTSNDNSIEVIWKPLMGGQEYKENSHYSVFNYNYLEKMLIGSGFQEIRNWDPAKVKNHNFDDWSSSYLEINDVKYPISLNIEAIK
ncbi:MAG: class I SAM-dependent methyltransferase [Melioribacteraceae bacterium]